MEENAHEDAVADCEDDPAIAETSSEVTKAVGDEENETKRLHVSCKDFGKVPQEKIEKWLAKIGTVPLKKVFKLKDWSYAFVSLKPDDVEKFREELESAIFRKGEVTVKDALPRDANNRFSKEQDEEPDRKRRKLLKSWPDGYVPSLKDVKEKEKAHKGAGIEKSMVQKSAPLLEWSYETQLKMKETYVKTTVRAFTKQVKKFCEQVGLPETWTDVNQIKECGAQSGCGCPVEPIIGTSIDGITGYRNKCEFTIGPDSNGDIECGMVLRIVGDGNQIISSADELPHVPASMKRLCNVVREHVKASPHAVFDRRRTERSGVWRLVMARQSIKGEMMIVVQIASLGEEARDSLAKALVPVLLGADLGIVSIFLQENDSGSDAAPADAKLFHIHGVERLDMPLLGLRFEIGPLSFFQTNSATCALLYERALSWLRPEGAIVLDICCGVGTIGLCAASHCKRVVGLELIPEAVDSARQNAALNGISNATFHVGKAEQVLPDLLPKLLDEEGNDREVCAMVDPPRPGLHKDVLTALRDCRQLSRIVYISCNPESLCEDVVKLCTPREDEDPLVPVRAVAVDMFPHTVHCEMILLLERASKVQKSKTAASTDGGEQDSTTPATVPPVVTSAENT